MQLVNLEENDNSTNIERLPKENNIGGGSDEHIS
jgi:hypothetical protein